MLNKKRTCLLPVKVVSVISKYELNINLRVLLAQPQKILTLRAITFQNGCNITGIVVLLADKSKIIINFEYKDKKFVCEKCNASWKTSSGGRKHVKNTSGRCNALNDVSNRLEDLDESEDESVGGSQTTVKIIHNLSMPGPKPKPKRSYDEVIISACGLEHSGQQEQDSAIWITKRLNLEPVTVTRLGKDDQEIMATHSTTQELNETLLTKTSFQLNVEDNFKKEPTQKMMYISDLMKTLIHKSPYKQKLLDRQYVEIEQQHSDLLNTDWDLSPEAKYATAQLIAEAVMINTKTFNAIIINTVETCGRGRTTDGAIKKSPVSTSLLPDGTFYDNIYSISMNDSDGEKLIIGTQSMNALVTSSLRLDAKYGPIFGAVTNNFSINAQESKDIRIFLDSVCVGNTAHILENKQNYINLFNMTGQLGQIRSKFHRPSSYYRCRCSGPLVNNHINKNIVRIKTEETVLEGSNEAKAALYDGLSHAIGFKVDIRIIVDIGDEEFDLACGEGCLQSAEDGKVENDNSKLLREGKEIEKAFRELLDDSKENIQSQAWCIQFIGTACHFSTVSATKHGYHVNVPQFSLSYPYSFFDIKGTNALDSLFSFKNNIEKSALALKRIAKNNQDRISLAKHNHTELPLSPTRPSTSTDPTWYTPPHSDRTKSRIPQYAIYESDVESTEADDNEVDTNGEPDLYGFIRTENGWYSQVTGETLATHPYHM